MKVNRTLAALTVAAAATLALTACSSNGSSPTTAPTTKTSVVSTPAPTTSPVTGQDDLVRRRRADEKAMTTLGFKVVPNSAGDTAVGMPYVVIDLCGGKTRTFLVHHDNSGLVDYAYPETNVDAGPNLRFTAQPTPGEIEKYGLCKS